MKQWIVKITSIAILFLIINNYIFPIISSATNMTAETKEKDNNNENVQLDAKINGEHNAKIEIKDTANLEITIKNNEQGYIKSIAIDTQECNFDFENTNIEELNGRQEDDNDENTEHDKKIKKINPLKSINENKIELNEILKNELSNVKIPVKFKETEKLNKELFDKESKIKMTATLVDDRGKNKEIKKEVPIKLIWENKSEGYIKQKLTRNIKYQQDKTILGFQIEEGLSEDANPVINKEIAIDIPKIGNQNPTKVIVLNNNDIKYESKDEKLLIYKAINEENIAWNTKDTFEIIYLYNTQSNEKEIVTTAESKDTLITGTIVESKEESGRFDISKESGYIIDVQTKENQALNKGYMFTNINKKEGKLETDYKATYEINIGYADLIDKLEIKEAKNEFLDSQDNVLKDAENNITNKKVTVNKDEIIGVLGENGTITVRDSNNADIGVLNKDNTSLEVNTSSLQFETSKLNKEGILKIEINKVINTNIDYSKEELQLFDKLESGIKVNQFNGENLISTLNQENLILLENPSSQSEVIINKDKWSTVVDNDDIILNIVLKANDIKTALYENSEASITLPNEVNQIDISSVNKLYDDELKIENMRIEDNKIYFNLNGTQTQYVNSDSEKGISIRIAMDIRIDNYATSVKEAIRFECINQSIGDKTVSEIPIEIIAPSGIILSNKIEIDDKSSTTFQDPVNDVLIDSAASEKEMIVSGTIINNLGYDTNNVCVIGRIPFEGNRTVNNQDLESNMNTLFASEVFVEGIEDTTISYSENGNETIEGDSWTSSINQSSKTFKINSNGVFKDKSTIKFIYKVRIPENIGYEKKGKTTYGVYYHNGSIEGRNSNLTEAIPIGITTGKEPEIKLDVSVIDTNEGYTIDDNGIVKEGEYVTIKAKIKNAGTIDANNVKVQLELPNGIVFVKYIPSSDSNPMARYIQDFSSKEMIEEVGMLKAGEEKDIEFPVKTSQMLSPIENNKEASKLQSLLKVNADILPEEIQKSYTLNNTEGTLNLKLASSIGNEKSNVGLFNYTIQIENANLKEKSNVVIKVKLPKGIEFVEMNNKYETKYDKKTKELTIYCDTVKAVPNIISFKAKLLDDIENRLVTQATATFIGSATEVKSNEVIFETEKTTDIIQANQSTNISNSVLDTDNLEFYIEVKNNSSERKMLQFSDTVPNVLKVNNYILEIDGQVVDQAKTNYIVSPFELDAGKTAKIKIDTMPLKQTKGKKYTIENSPLISMNDTGIKVNTISIDINGTQPELYQLEDQQEKKGKTKEEKEEEKLQKSDIIYREGTNRISGIAWIDENKNGKIDIGEKRIENQEITIYDLSSNSIVKDEQDNMIKVRTNQNGEYIFTNIKPGKYYLLSTFNSRECEPTKYKVQELGEEENSDFTIAKYDEKEVLSTDTIDITTQSAYNVNLGLSYKDIFDLKLEQEISKIIITDTKNRVKEYKYDKYSEKRKVEINPKEVKEALIEYTIRVKNEGNQPGYAKTIVDYLPTGMKFNSEINPDWYLKNDGNVYNSTLIDTEIEPGETKELKLVAIKQLNENTLGNIRNTAELYTTYNQKGLKTIDAKAGNKVDGEKDMDSTDAIIINPSKVKVFTVIVVSILIIGLLVFGVWFIMKRRFEVTYKAEKIEGIDK